MLYISWNQSLEIISNCLHSQHKRLQLTQMHFIKVKEIKLIQIELFSFFILRVQLLMYPNCFVWSYKPTINFFNTILTFHFNYQISCARKDASVSARKFVFSRKWVKLTQIEWPLRVCFWKSNSADFAFLV